MLGLGLGSDIIFKVATKGKDSRQRSGLMGSALLCRVYRPQVCIHFFFDFLMFLMLWLLFCIESQAQENSPKHASTVKFLIRRNLYLASSVVYCSSIRNHGVLEFLPYTIVIYFMVAW